MKKTILKSALVALFLAAPVAAFAAQGLIGDCADCHTMHNSEQGAAVATLGTAGTTSTTPIENLLRMDCISCHANDPAGADKIVDMGGGSTIPQVWHSDASGDLAGGNWKYLDEGTSRNGHNVADLFAGGDDNGGTYGAPPGKYRLSTHGGVFSVDSAFDKFTCAGSAGCHGTRSQMLSGTTADWDGNTSTANTFSGTKRTGIAAISGAHHNSYDGAKAGPQYVDGVDHDHDGQKVADGYRFIPGLKGYGNEAARWQNVDASSHNEYYGDDSGADIGSCGWCHNQGHAGGDSSRMAFDSTLRVPNGSMSGFCATCHGAFHSVGDLNGSYTDGRGPNNGVSGAFLRHPSDYVIPNSGEYAAYTAYEMTAPVARPTLYTAASADVTPGTDMVMCLSCHIAHASANDYMLRFDYTLQTAGNALAGDLGTGCLACHTTKGILPENR